MTGGTSKIHFTRAATNFTAPHRGIQDLFCQPKAKRYMCSKYQATPADP
ncbi:hypothetical protein TGAM01_v204899 [Trichoderma gamsii]|uniref:Uncharacterized protein n=1 Tax=Trichoderma gamsii TaxID=398673 RepID=A0A2P4ZQ78_9HYPO|nr:hypothetical protein TGAM01_v204899 [Trichoderma gamsii]PON26423.1 hypothetical protein TGAM01_v204899 [Trichoderma gamsii]